MYDRGEGVAEDRGQNLKGNHLGSRVDVPGAPEVNQGINITVGVQFSEDAPDVRSMQIEIVGAGIEFLGQ